MKKVLMGILLVVSLFALTACTSNKLTKLNYDKLVKKFDNGDTFILLFNDGSSDGELLKSTLNNLLNEFDLEGYVINPTSLSQDEKNDLRSKIYIETNGIAFINKGVDSSKLAHVTDVYTTRAELLNHLINHGFIDANEEKENNN